MVKEIEYIEERAFKIFKSLDLSLIVPGLGLKEPIRKRLGNYAHYSLFNLLSVSLGCYSLQFTKIYYIATKIFGMMPLRMIKNINLLNLLKNPGTAKLALIVRIIPLIRKFFIDKKILTSKEFLDGLNYGFSNVGTGYLRKINVENKNIKLIFEDTYSAGFPNIHKKTCVWGGIFAGILADINNYDVIETKCVANGDKHCEFLIYENRYGKIPTFIPFTEKETDKIIKTLMENLVKDKRIRKKISDDGALFALQILNYLFVGFYKFQPIIVYRGIGSNQEKV
ncbi:MAG: 4-vinyl reductase [Candidatus Aenigmatarchaeota archaeon]